jgi:hypothetical protein
MFPVALSLPKFKTFDEYRYKISFALFMRNQNQCWKRQTFLDAKKFGITRKIPIQGFLSSDSNWFKW